ncbi:extracellular solute-binding protein [Pseudomonas sp. LRF_L74]|uniref:extracellular solute-binding protein n=1 Tax=Pseudomonas sp. LRF_L74 TaxID=3369422 RepID=UPI003F5DDF48
MVMLWAPAGGWAATSHALTVYDEQPVKYPETFAHFDFVDPQAPKGGTLRMARDGSFDSLNPFISKGNPAFTSASQSPVKLEWLYDSLTFQSLDEPATEYGLIAERIERSPQRDWVRFYLRAQARFHDGHPLTADDVAFTFELLKTQGDPLFRINLAEVSRVVVEGPLQVRFDLSNPRNRQLPLLLGQMKIMPRHWWASRTFDRTTLEAPMTSGPYRIVQVDAGRRIVLERVKDWWARDLPVSRGLYNFDRISLDFYRDRSIALESFRAGQFDLNYEDSSKNWAVGYASPALRDGSMVKLEAPDYNVRATLVAFSFNIRKDRFHDARVRQAIAELFDFEWTNRNIFYGAYRRRHSFFPNSDMEAKALPDSRELAVLEPLRGRIDERAFTQVFKAPLSDGSGTVRAQKERAFALLGTAGYHYRDGRMRGPDGVPLSFEFLLNTSYFERILLPFKRNLAELGIDMQIRLVDGSQYINRLRSRDYDMILTALDQPSSPGIEQIALWHSSSADNPGSRNFIGLRDPLIDQLVEGVVDADSREDMIAHARALDRALQWGYYVVPGYMQDTKRVAYWNRFGRPALEPSFVFTPMTWWQRGEKPQPAGGGL